MRPETRPFNAFDIFDHTGAPRIHGELLKLGIDISETSVSKYMVRCRKPPSQTLAHLPAESRAAASLHRFLHRAHNPLSGPVRLPGIGP
jgi:hypothetical protein